MKKREFIFAICFICILGMLVTVQVRRLVSGSAQRADVQEYAATEEHKLQKENQTGSATSPRIEPEYPEGAAGRGKEAADRSAAVVPETEEDKETVFDAPAAKAFSLPQAAPGESGAAENCLEDSESIAETPSETKAPVQESQNDSGEEAIGVLVSPASETVGQAGTETEKAGQITAQDYQRELDSAAASIKKLKSSETDTSTWSYLNLADYELKIWDDLLNRIYQDIIENMDETVAEELRQEEKAWIKKRDADAKKVSSRYSGGTLEGLEHTASLAQSTKDRAYELLEDYGSYLPQEEISEEK